ncbi:hypothetical protein PINS_up004691 [Pythium insidiosum]|nr:hypothetical protein PINS_up004691 [Pythium insidiosum]
MAIDCPAIVSRSDVPEITIVVEDACTLTRETTTALGSTKKLGVTTGKSSSMRPPIGTRAADVNATVNAASAPAFGVDATRVASANGVRTMAEPVIPEDASSTLPLVLSDRTE